MGFKNESKMRKPLRGVRLKQKIILAAARKIAVKDGVAQLTIEAVAKQAGVSKGGVLYHYPSKKKTDYGLNGSICGPLKSGIRNGFLRKTKTSHMLLSMLS